MSQIGYYRYKINPTIDIDIDFSINYELAATKSVIVKEWCDNDKLIKYLNKDGQYRFFAFNRFWESNDKPKELGRSNKIITSLLTSKSSEDILGYKNERILTLMAHDISQDELTVLSDLWTSPRVLMYVGDHITFSENDWIQVSIKAKNNLTRIKKSNYTDIIVDITLPEWYTISML